MNLEKIKVKEKDATVAISSAKAFLEAIRRLV